MISVFDPRYDGKLFVVKVELPHFHDGRAILLPYSKCPLKQGVILFGFIGITSSGIKKPTFAAYIRRAVKPEIGQGSLFNNLFFVFKR